MTHRLSAYMKLRVPLWRLVVSVYVEKDGGQDTFLWQAVLLFSPSTMLIVQFHIEPPTGQHVLDYST